MSQRSLFSLLNIAILFFFSFLICVWFDLSFLLAIIIPLLAIAGLLVIWSPVWFLGAFLLLRMSLDILGDTLSIPINQTFSLSLSQGIGIGIALLSIIAIFKHKIPRSAFKLTTPLGVVLLCHLVEELDDVGEVHVSVKNDVSVVLDEGQGDDQGAKHGGRQAVQQAGPGTAPQILRTPHQPAQRAAQRHPPGAEHAGFGNGRQTLHERQSRGPGPPAA